MPLRYQAFGLQIESDFPVPGAFQPEAFLASSSASIVIRSAPTPEPDGKLHDGPYSSAAGGLLFDHPSAARFFVPYTADTLLVEPKPGSRAEDISGYLIATALPMLLWLRGDMLLHAAVATLPGTQTAVAFAGPSGSGKSTLLLKLMAAGAFSIAEDCTCLRWQDGELIASGLPTRIHLRTSKDDLTTPRTCEDLSADRCKASAAISAIVVLAPEAPEQSNAASLTRLTATDALAALLRNRHRHRIPGLLSLSTKLLPRWAGIASHIPVYTWHRQPSDQTDIAALQRTLQNNLPITSN